MKTLFFLASLMVVVVLIAPEKIGAQNKQSKSTLPEITTTQMPKALARQVGKDDKLDRNHFSCQLCGNGEPYDDLTERSVDLNGDGSSEWLMSYCGMHTCSGWIYRKVADRYEPMLAGFMGDVSYTTPMDTFSNGYSDLRNDDGEAFAMILKFDGRHYKLTECLTYKPTYDRQGTLLRRRLIRRGPCPK